MYKSYVFNNDDYNPYLYLSSGGNESSEPLHQYGPAGRTGYMIHYVSDGKGYFTSNNKTYTLTKGAFFFIEPGKIIKMKADKNDPWSFQWIRFKGKLVDEYIKKIKINYKNCIFYINDHHAQIIRDKMYDIIELSHMDQDNDFLYNAKLLQILDQLKAMYPNKSDEGKIISDKILTRSMQFIRNNNETPITVLDVVDYVSRDRTYLYKIFKKELNMGPKEYLTQCRIRKARELLETTDNPINIIAYSCGYTDPLHFSKSFLQNMGMSPSQYRNSNQKEIKNNAESR